MHQLIFSFSIWTHPSYSRFGTTTVPPFWMIVLHRERRRRTCPYTWNTKIQKTHQGPYLGTLQSLTDQNVRVAHRDDASQSPTEYGSKTNQQLWPCSTSYKEDNRRAGPQNISYSRVTGITTSSHWLYKHVTLSLRSKPVALCYWELQAHIYAMAKPFSPCSYFRLTWALGNMLEDPP